MYALYKPRGGECAAAIAIRTVMESVSEEDGRKVSLSRVVEDADDRFARPVSREKRVRLLLRCE